MKKALFTRSIILLVLLSISAVSMTVQASKPSSSPPALEKITFVHYAKSDSTSSKPAWDDTVDIYKLMLGGIKWEDTMQYEVNCVGSGLTEEEVLTVLGASLDTWDTAITGDFELFDDPIVLDDELNPGDLDNRNIVVWEDLSEIYGANVIAVNSFWFNPALKVIVDSDVVFSTNFDWSLSGETGKMDLQNIATHEFGHNGLNDLYMPPSKYLTMYGYSADGDTTKTTLGTGDISGIQALYGP